MHTCIHLQQNIEELEQNEEIEQWCDNHEKNSTFSFAFSLMLVHIKMFLVKEKL